MAQIGAYIYVHGGTDGTIHGAILVYHPANCSTFDAASCLNDTDAGCALCDGVCVSAGLSPISSSNCSAYVPVSGCTVDPCMAQGSCAGCNAVAGCSWCSALQQCVSANHTCTAISTECTVPAPVQPCSSQYFCSQCESLPDEVCSWQPDLSTCVSSTAPVAPCPAPCTDYTNCTGCLGDGGNTCLWCAYEARCIDVNGYLSNYDNGQCLYYRYGGASQCYRALRTTANAPAAVPRATDRQRSAVLKPVHLRCVHAAVRLWMVLL